MATDSEIRTTAALLIERLGAEAAAKAYDVAEGFADLGSRERERLWIRIARAIEALQDRRESEPSEADE
jgi:hypothetical protein